MISLRPPRHRWPRAGVYAKSVALAVLFGGLMAAPSVLLGAPAGAKVRGKARISKPGPVQAPAVAPAGLPEFADAYPSEIRPAAADLALEREEERKAEALTAFAQALIAEDNADSEKALAGYRRTLEFDPSYAELAVKVAYELARRNDVSAGIQILKDAIKAAPKEPLPLIYLSQLYSKHLKKPDLALKYAEQALLLAPENFLAHSALFELYVAAAEPKKAEQALERAAKLGNPDPKFWLQLGELFTRLYLKEDGTSEPPGLEKMSAIFRKASQLGKGDAAVQARVGDYFVLSRQVKEAIPFYLAALSLKQPATEPPLERLRDKLARAYMVNQQRDEAITELEQLAKEQPTNLGTHELLGELYEQKGDAAKALASYEHSLLLDSTQPDNFLRVAEMLLKAKRYDKAVETLIAARKRFPDRPRITFGLGLSLSKAKRHTEAMTVFAEARAEAENNLEELLGAPFFLEYANAAEQAGLTEKAEELIRHAIDLDPQNAAQAYNFLGYMWADRGERLEEAGEMIGKALEMDPDNGAFIDSLGWLHFKKGEHEKALKELLRAAESIKPEDPVVLDHIGDVYLALGKTGDALTYWQKALALEQDNPKIVEKIEAAKQKVTSVPPAPSPAQ